MSGEYRPDPKDARTVAKALIEESLEWYDDGNTAYPGWVCRFCSVDGIRPEFEKDVTHHYLCPIMVARDVLTGAPV